MIQLEAGSDGEAALWHTLLDLAERAEHWTLIGARMVELHAAEAGRTILQTSLDGDVLADARARPNAVRRIAQILADEDFSLEEPSYQPWFGRHPHRYSAARTSPTARSAREIARAAKAALTPPLALYCAVLRAERIWSMRPRSPV